MRVPGTRFSTVHIARFLKWPKLRALVVRLRKALCWMIRADDVRRRPLAVRQPAMYPSRLAMRRWHWLPRQLRRAELYGGRRREAVEVVGGVSGRRATADTVRRQPVPLCHVARVYKQCVALWRWRWLHGLQWWGRLWVLIHTYIYIYTVSTAILPTQYCVYFVYLHSVLQWCWWFYGTENWVSLKMRDFLLDLLWLKVLFPSLSSGFSFFCIMVLK